MFLFFPIVFTTSISFYFVSVSLEILKHKNEINRVYIYFLCKASVWYRQHHLYTHLLEILSYVKLILTHLFLQVILHMVYSNYKKPKRFSEQNGFIFKLLLNFLIYFQVFVFVHQHRVGFIFTFLKLCFSSSSP